MIRLPLLLAALCLVPAVHAQSVIPSWTTTTPLPDATQASAVTHRNNIYVFAVSSAYVGSVDHAGNIAAWRPVPKPPTQAWTAGPGYVVIGDTIIFASYPNSYLTDILPDGSLSPWRPAPGANPRITEGGNATITNGTHIWSIGGCCLGTLEARLSNVDVATFSNGVLSPWRPLADYPVAIQEPGVSIVGGYLYTYGGLNNGGALIITRDVRRARILPGGDLGPWEFVGLLNEHRPKGEGFEYQGSIHLVSGGVHTYATSTTESVLSTAIGLPGSAVYSAPLPAARADYASAVVYNYGFVIAGCASSFCGTKSNTVFRATLGPADQTPPTSSATRTPPPNIFQWNNSDVRVDIAAQDDPNGLGVASLQWSSAGAQFSPPASVSGAATSVNFNTEGLSTLSYFASDLAGNAEVPRLLDIAIDKTAPLIAASRTPANTAGWNNADVLVAFTCTDALSGPLSPGSQTLLTAESAALSASGACQDRAGNTAALTVDNIRIDKTRPVVESLAASPIPAPSGTAITVSATLRDALSGIAAWQHSVDGVWFPAQSASGLAPSVSAPVAQSTPGVVPVCVRATDLAGNTSAEDCLYAVFYDPAAGFVTGGGWFQSPAGAFAADPSLTGKASFGFVARYQPGATIPSGNTEFQFKAGNLNFKSTSYDWLVVAGAKAQFKGSGSINGTGDFEFMITATDGDQSSGPDRFRIRIREQGGGVVYDNQPGGIETADPVTALGGGGIVIHR